eukprot:TRINITY_DN9143_c0_g1_i2.p1 TRINITY_DN9143_c0_g1~~TRINITY_DN9143_c0_g1_i2.p1  ORF type:complete len:445 (-),score=93.21 TRINITY_DN9143_c0_g1_i2:41-1375(-)
MDKLIPVVSKLQEIYNQAKLPSNLSLPQIVVVGAQSSGKTSVLESVIGGDFLPRGSGIVTRAPLCLHLKHVDSGSECAVFAHRPEIMYTEFSEIREEIARRTREVTGNETGISKEVITLKMYSRSVLDLTLVDLPGLTSVPVGSQPQDIDVVVRELVLSYIENPNSVILVISPANVDIANSDSLHLARKVDPKGDRTIGVLTKLDIMNKGTNASAHTIKMLEGKKYPLKLGYVGVVCRSQEDINKNKSMGEALAKEQEFFDAHPEYAKVKNGCGIPYLTKKLNELLALRIMQCLPSLKQSIEAQLHDRIVELNSYGFVPKDKNMQNMQLVRLIGEYSKELSASIEDSINPVLDNLGTGARINLIFNEIYANSLTSLTPLQNLTEVNIRTAILNAKALSPSLFIPESAVEMLIRSEIDRCLKPSLCCALQAVSYTHLTLPTTPYV